MKRIISLVLALVLLVSAFAVLPVAAGNTAEDGVYVYLDEGFHIVFVTDGEETSVAVAAKEMADYKTNGTYTVSLQDYAKELIADGGEKASTVNLLNAMLGYGRAAADYFNYVYCDPDEGSIVIDGTPVTDTADLLAAEAPEATYTDDAGIYIGATLILEGTMKLRFYFAGTDITATVDGAAATATAADGYSYVDVAVMPYDMAKAVTVQAGATTVTYAPINYLQNKATDATLSTMVASIYAYGLAAEAYVAEANACKHEGIFLEVITPATMYYTGTGKNVCPDCDFEEDVVIEKTKAKINPMTTSDAKTHVIREEVPFTTILGDDKHFYPTENDADGSDLLIEFSLLMNDSFVYIGDSKGIANVAFPGVEGESAHWLFLESGGDAPAGQFDYWNSNAQQQIYSTDIQLNFDGWYRFGVRYHQNTHIDGDTVTYDMTVTLYINGVRVHEYVQKTGSNKFLLYTAEVKNGNVEYTDLTDRSALIYHLGNAYTRGGNSYLPTADLFATCGDDFVMDVEPMTNPKAEKFIQDGIQFSGIRYFKIKGEIEEHEHKGLSVVTVPTVFADGYAQGVCTVCGQEVSGPLAKTEATIYEIKQSKNDAFVIRDSEKLGDILGENQHFYPTTENPEGRSLYIEFSMLLNGTMNNFGNTNITFPGIYTNNSLDSGFGEAAFWYYIKAADGIAQGSYDDWTSNALKDLGYYNAKTALAMDGWHRFGFEFHQNTTINGDNVSYTMTVTMYMDGTRVYEATLGAKTDATAKMLLYTAEVVDGEVIYTDRVDTYAAYYRYTAYVTNGTPAYFVVADQYMSCEGFTLNVSPVENPEAQDFTQDGVTLSGKQYFTVNN